jgi:CBS domain-containing protein
LWFALIGWFLIAASGAEMQSTLAEMALGPLTVGQVMETEFLALPSYQYVGAAARRAVDADTDVCPVCDIDGRPVAVVNVDRLVQAAASGGDERRVVDVAVPIRPEMLTTPDERLSRALQRAGGHGLMLVVVDARLVGIVTPIDVSRARRRGLLEAIPAG